LKVTKDGDFVAATIKGLQFFSIFKKNLKELELFFKERSISNVMEVEKNKFLVIGAIDNEYLSYFDRVSGKVLFNFKHPFIGAAIPKPLQIVYVSGINCYLVRDTLTVTIVDIPKNTVYTLLPNAPCYDNNNY
jgi:hypothetical protein